MGQKIFLFFQERTAGSMKKCGEKFKVLSQTCSYDKEECRDINVEVTRVDVN